MIDGDFIAYEYSMETNGKVFRGFCADVSADTKFEGLGDSREDKMAALGIVMACAFGHQFMGGEDWANQKYRISYDRGKSWQHQNRKFKMDGNRVILVNSLTRQDCPASETGVMTLDGDILTITNERADGKAKMTYKKV